MKGMPAPSGPMPYCLCGRCERMREDAKHQTTKRKP